jgi:hypothetical protein
MKKALIILAIISFSGLCACDTSTSTKVTQHIDKGYKTRNSRGDIISVDNLTMIGGYTLIEKHRFNSGIWIFILAPTKAYELWKKEEIGLIPQRVKEKKVYVTEQVYLSVFEGEAIPLKVENESPAPEQKK